MHSDTAMLLYWLVEAAVLPEVPGKPTSVPPKPCEAQAFVPAKASAKVE